MWSDLAGFGLIWGAFGALLGGLGILRRYMPRNPELLRKLLHAGMGLVALSLPWLFASVWPVVLLTASIIAVLMGIRWFPPLRQMVGGVIHGVERNSWGEIFFALGVAVLYMLSHKEPLLFSVSIFILVLADTAASLIGSRYGRLHYEVLGENKSVEGSLAFLIAAFLVTEFGLLVFTSLGSLNELLMALALALPITLVEAEAGKGSDNFLLPLVTFLLLKSLLAFDRIELVVFLVVTAVAVPMAFFFLYDASYPDSSGEGSSSLGIELSGLGNWT